MPMAPRRTGGHMGPKEFVESALRELNAINNPLQFSIRRAELMNEAYGTFGSGIATEIGDAIPDTPETSTGQAA